MAEEKNIDDDDDLELEIVDDTPEEDRDRSRPKEDDSKSDDDAGDGSGDDSDEHEEYSKRVQKRIDQLKYEYHEERRAKDEATRLRDESINYAQTLQAELDRLRRQVNDGRDVLYKQASDRIEAQIATAQRELKEAYDLGESDRIVEAQTKIAKLAAEGERVNAFKSRPQPQPQPPQQPVQRQPQPQPQPQVTARDQAWVEANPWFMRDQKMTAYAYGVHDEITKKGVSPGSEEYYRQIDEDMRKVFPGAFKDNSKSEEADGGDDVVAPPSRKAPRKPRTVRLTRTQVALAERLGITPEQYAEQLMKEQANG